VVILLLVLGFPVALHFGVGVRTHSGRY
jgi:hypothetical protein